MESRALKDDPLAINGQAPVTGHPGSNDLGILIVVDSERVTLRRGEKADHQSAQSATCKQSNSHAFAV